MRIAVYKPIFPWPPVQGTRRVTVALLRALASAHEVTLIAPLQAGEDAGTVAALERETGARTLVRPAPNRASPVHRAWYKARYLLQSAAGGHSPRALYATPEALLAAAAEWSRSAAPDLAIFEYWYSYRAMARLTAHRRVLLAHDAEFRVNRLAAGARGRWAAAEARREAEACRAVDQVWTLTDEDRLALAGHAGLSPDRFRVMPFGVDLARLELPAGGGGETVLFFGAFQADFNRDALAFLLAEIWPRVREARPTARLLVAGGGLPESLAAGVRAAGGEAVGAVDDVRALYAGAAIVLIPLRFGGGLRIRLLEALAGRRAVVATPVGVSGIPGEEGRHWRTAGDATGLAGAILELLADPARGRALGESGHDLVARDYSESAAARRILALAGTV